MIKNFHKIIASISRANFEQKYILNKNHQHHKRFLFTSAIPDFIQAYVSGLHDVTGTPWWATIALSTVFVRVSLFPLVRYQYIHLDKLAGAMPELSFLAQLLRQRFINMKKQAPSLISLLRNEEAYRILSIFIKGVRACLVIHNVKIAYIIGLPLTNIAVFITFIYSLREMILDESTLHKFFEGGMFWFVNLQDKDATFILPFLSLFLSYSALELAFSKFSSPSSSHTSSTTVSPIPSGAVPTSAGKYLFFFKDRFSFILFFKDIFQSIQIFSIPIVLSLPNGIFCYWIPSSLMNIAQILLMRTEWFRKLMRLPIPPKPAHLKSSSVTTIGNDSQSVTTSNNSSSQNMNKHFNSQDDNKSNKL